MNEIGVVLNHGLPVASGSGRLGWGSGYVCTQGADPFGACVVPLPLPPAVVRVPWGCRP